jgi:hypothetical protein
LGHQTKTHSCLLQKIKILIIKVNETGKLSNANDSIDAIILFIQQQEVVESKQIQPTGEQLSIVIDDECVGLAWWNYVCQYSAGVYLQCHTCKFFFYKNVFSQFRLGGS